MPPGVAGMEPNLSLAYSSGAGDGPLGVGWSLQGLSAIARCGRDVGRDDGRNDRLFRENENAPPALCLDGERLVENDCGGSCDPNEPFEAHHYRGESTADWVVDRVYAGTGQEADAEEMNELNTNFVVRHRDGTEAVYGGTGAVIRSLLFEATEETPAEHPSEGGSPEPDWGDLDARTYAWLLREVRDPSGNRMEIEYSASRADGAVEVLPSVIRYTGTSTTTGSRRVEFAYETRADSVTHYTGGFALGSFRRLLKVTTFAPGVGVGGAIGPVREYRLNYDTSGSTGRLLLDSVVECSLPGGAGERCRQPVDFQYEDAPVFEIPSNGFVPAQISGADAEFGTAGGAWERHSWAVTDHDGDGAHELLVDDKLWRLDGVVEGSDIPDLVPFARFDHDADGIDELFAEDGKVYAIVPDGSGGYTQDFEASITGPMGSGDVAHYVGNFTATSAGMEGWIEDVGLSVVDLDGDGVHDLANLGDLYLPNPPPLLENIWLFRKICG